MTSINYTIDAKPTEYEGVLFRSRLEAQWAAFFDLARWRWTYEPCEVGGYNPDFLIEADPPRVVEVKPLTTVTEIQLGGLAPKLEQAAFAMGPDVEPLILGIGPRDLGFLQCGRLPALGITRARRFDPAPGVLSSFWPWSTATLVTLAGQEEEVSIWYDGDDGSHDGLCFSAADAVSYWRRAGKLTRFDIRRSQEMSSEELAALGRHTRRERGGRG